MAENYNNPVTGDYGNGLYCEPEQRTPPRESFQRTDKSQAMGSDAAGWLHQGTANRLALDMGLNMDPSVLSGAVALPPIEIELRRQIYWALYCHDKLSASYTGRVCTVLVCLTSESTYFFPKLT